MFGIGRQVNYLANPTGATDPSWSSVIMLVHGDDSTWDSKRGQYWPVSGSDVAASTAQSKFGGSSIFCNNSDVPQNGTDSYMYGDVNSVWNIGTGDFTFEAWVYPLRTTGLNAIWDFRELGGSVSPSFFVYNGAWASYSNGWLFESAGSVSTNTWYHVAMVRSGSTTKLYVNGSSTATVTDSRDYVCGAFPRFGAGWNSNDGFYGYIDDLRITKGVARYTSNFSVPTEAFPNS